MSFHRRTQVASRFEFGFGETNMDSELHEETKSAVTALIWCNVTASGEQNDLIADLIKLLSQENLDNQEQILGDGFFAICSRMSKPIPLAASHWRLAVECVIYRDSISWEPVTTPEDVFTEAFEVFLSKLTGTTGSSFLFSVEKVVISPAMVYHLF
jgi:hypothetical protein